MKPIRDKLGRFVKGNKEGNRFGGSNGLASEDARAMQKRSVDSKREKRTDREICEMLDGMPIPDNAEAIHKMLRSMGLPDNEHNFQVAYNARLYFDAVAKDAKVAHSAIKQINDIKNGGKLDITTNGKELNREPLIIEVIDSREQVDKNEDE